MESTVKSYFFESLSDDLIISILSKLRSSVEYPSYFISVLFMYMIVLLPFTDIVFIFAFVGKLSNPTSRRIQPSIFVAIDGWTCVWICENILLFLFGTSDKKSACEINLFSFYNMSFEGANVVDFLK